MTGTDEGKKRFSKYFARTSKFTEYYARGGKEYVRDRNAQNIDLSELPKKWNRFRFDDITQLSKRAHALNWMVFRGKKYDVEQQVAEWPQI